MITQTHPYRMGIFAEPATYTDADGSARQTVLVMTPRITMGLQRDETNWFWANRPLEQVGHSIEKLHKKLLKTRTRFGRK